ncbi:MAG: NAD(P)-dependent glycerol-3-phosphate dehydrogenase [Oscillospiraceae bacterium]|nr:NAD(P)-dependent glycerol-3-phosphate dehydrogenase [Oscillospiraceae bacterium]
MANIFILGCGFGTALSVLWSNAGHRVICYSNFPEEIETIKREGEHKRLLPGIAIPAEIEFTCDISKAANADIVVFAVPSKFIGQAAMEAAPYIPKNAVVVNVSKGFAECVCENDCGSSHTLPICRLSEIIGVFVKRNPMVILTGPCHAEEVGRGCPTAVVAASLAREYAEYIQTTLQTKSFRIYINDDIVGSELGGALKNPIALCCGIALGMGLGDNAVAAIMTRGMSEIKRLGTALGAKWQTFTGLAGVGDLIVTCTSKHSRNHRAGLLIGQGVSASDAVKQVGTVEGYECVKIALRLAKERGIDIPIFEQLYKVCYEGFAPEKALQGLMNRPQRDEREFFW